MDSENNFIKVDNDNKRRNISLKNIEPINGIQIVRELSESDSESSLSSESSQSTVKPKKTKKVLRKKEPQINFNAFSNPKKVSQFVEQNEENDSASEYSESSAYESEYSREEKQEKDSWEEKQKLKQDLLIKIQMLEKKGFEFSKKFTMNSNFDEMLFEYNKIKKFIETQATIKFSRRCLMACVTGLEFLNKKFDPFNVKLEGWSENVLESVEDYDNIFERLHEKYSGKAEIAPELELLLTLGGSAFMFHLTNSLFKSPAMNIIGQNNPNFLSSMMGAMSEGMKEMNKPPNFRQPGQGQPQNNFPKPMETRGIRREMKGPSIDPGLFNQNVPPQFPQQQQFPQSQQIYYDSNPIEEDDRFSVASSDSSLSSVSTVVKSVKNVSITKKKGKGGKGGIELNIS